MNYKNSDATEAEIKNISFEIKAEDVDDSGKFKGFGSTFGGDPDSYGDIVEKGSFANTIKNNGYGGLGIKQLWQHNWNQPIGVWEQLSESSKGLAVIGQLTLGVRQADEALLLLKSGAINAMSIGFNTIEARSATEDERKKGISRFIKEVELFEISLVTFPANTRAKITQVKSAIECATNMRELEDELSKFLSGRAAKYVASLCSKGLFETNNQKDAFSSMVGLLRDINDEFKK